MNPMNTHTQKHKERALHMRVLWTIAALCLIQSLIANVAFAQVKYSLFSDPQAIGGTQGPTGVRGAGGQDVYVTGIYHPPTPTPSPGCPPTNSNGLLYVGPLSGGGNSGSWTILNYPSSPGITVTGTALYGPDNLPPSNVRLVGSYTKCEDPTVRNHGLLYEGPTDGSGTWQTIDFPDHPGEHVFNTIAHSTMGGLVVGNFDTGPLTGKAFVYDIDADDGDHWTELPKPPGVISITAYGIWYNGGTSYTIAGGYAELNFPGNDQHGYLLNWDSSSRTVSDWRSYDFDNGHTQVEVSHFDGITTDNQGGFYLTGTWLGGDPQHIGGFFAHVRRMPHQAFGEAHWRDIEYPSSPEFTVESTTGNTVFENKVLGIFMADHHTVFQGYLATVQGHR
jgi:hypothetical protein